MYVDAHLKKNGEKEVINVVERVNGDRVYKEFQPDYHYYISDPTGSYFSIYNTPLKKVCPRTSNEKRMLLRSASSNVTTWESDVDPVFRCLEQNYQNCKYPDLHVMFLDIETSFSQETGWSTATDATNPITAISVYFQWMDKMLCLAVPPTTVTWEEANTIAENVGNTMLFKTEGELLSTFLEVIQDVDVISGWNSSLYDLPFIINRIKKVLGKHEANNLCLWGVAPRARELDRGGKIEQTYDLVGRSHLDYLELYKNYNYEERHSYKLNSIAEIELGENKVDYEGTLDDLYNDDFKLFLEYNIQDTRLLNKLDRKLQFIQLANSYAHTNCVLLKNVLGVVSAIDQAILVEAHNNNKIVPDRKSHENSDTRAAGGWVSYPKKGLHKWIASTDMKSLYPSVIRALNVSPETVVGQIRLDRTNEALQNHESQGSKTKYTFASWWNERFNVLEMEEFYNKDIGTRLILDLEDGTSHEVTGKELHDLIFNSGMPWCISANGTIFKTDKEGIIPSLLTKWYNERKKLQRTKTEFEELLNGIPIGE